MSRSETYAALAPKLLDAGYEVLPIVPNQKRPRHSTLGPPLTLETPKRLTNISVNARVMALA